MKQFKTILKFELDNYFKSKSYVLSTILITVIGALLMFIPRIADSIKSDKDDAEEQAQLTPENAEADDIYALYDENGFVDAKDLEAYIGHKIVVECASADEVRAKVENEEAVYGFVVKSLNEYDFYLYNKGMFEEGSTMFNEYMSLLVKLDYCEKNNLDLNEFMDVSYKEIVCNENVLGKDSTRNYWYCYILVIIVFMLIIMYGVTIASSVTNEKSNRSIEILVTSTDSTALLFGKVFAGTIATVFQVGVIALGLLGSYQLNKSYMPVDLASFLDIPTDVLITFAVFGVGGFILYAFLYGALGALVSKIEDLNKTAGTAQMIVMIVYFVVLIQLTNIDGVVMKICSFLPISSYSAMFARVAMGNVEMWEIVVSAVLLYASVIGMGILGGKIFRNSTLRYGNPIKLSSALKGLKKSE